MDAEAETALSETLAGIGTIAVPLLVWVSIVAGMDPVGAAVADKSEADTELEAAPVVPVPVNEMLASDDGIERNSEL